MFAAIPNAGRMSEEKMLACRLLEIAPKTDGPSTMPAIDLAHHARLSQACTASTPNR